MKRRISLVILFALLMVCPLFAADKSMTPADQAVACLPDAAPSHIQRETEAAIATEAEAVSRPASSKFQTQTLDSGCEFSCLMSTLVATDFGRDVAEYPAFWVKYDGCVYKYCGN